MTTTILEASPLWPATLDHIRYDSPDAARLADFYVRAMGMSATELGSGEFLVEAPVRSIVIGTSQSAGQPYSAFALRDDAHLDAYRAFLASHVELLPSPTGLFGGDAFAVRDPDGLAVFGTRTRPARPASGGSAARAVLRASCSTWSWPPAVSRR
jgi:catechol 2,3-dioxygenase-like lactoylglutathione lyase family enzyme